MEAEADLRAVQASLDADAAKTNVGLSSPVRACLEICTAHRHCDRHCAADHRNQCCVLLRSNDI